MNPPTFRPILIAKFIEQELDREINRLQLPWLTIREGGIRTGWRKSRIADIYVVTREQVIEVVSPDSIKRDYRYKRSEYAALGINEYWIIDPLEQKVTILVWDEGLYEEAVFSAAQELVSPTFSEIKLTPQHIFTTENI